MIENPKCPYCKKEGVDNLNMVITIITEQPLSFYKQLPNMISLNRKSSANSSYVIWDNMTVTCRACGYASKDISVFSTFKDKSILQKIRNYLKI